MTAQEAYEHHRQRAYRDPDDDPVTAVFWDDPIEVTAVVDLHVRARTPADAWSDATSPKGRKMLDALWSRFQPSQRQLYRTRAAILLQAGGAIREAR